jgi:nitroreductase
VHNDTRAVFILIRCEVVMEKPAPNQHPLHDLIRRRWSPRAFADRPVEPHKLLSLLEAARWAPSANNEQPWYFMVATRDDEVKHSRLASCLSDSNYRWAPKAPVLMLTVAKTHFEKYNKPNRHAFHDVGQAVAQLVLQAMAMGLYVHQMAGINPDKAREVCGIPEGYDPVTIIAIGYPGSMDEMPDDLRERELKARSRRGLEEFVFTGNWGETSPLVKKTQEEDQSAHR